MSLPQKKKVVCAMSGGVDSSVAAALLLREGYDVLGVFLRLGSPKGVETPDTAACSTDPAKRSHKQGCCSVNDAADARRVAGILGIPFYVLNFEDSFSRIVDNFVSEYNAGRTPNPCVRCNDWLKFGRLAQYADAVGADFVASGHYARIGVDPLTGTKALMRGLDHRKDQSYVLFGMQPNKLDRTLLPIGDMEKPRVRELANELNLPTYNKPDSQEICFVPDHDYAALVRRHDPQRVRTGPLVASSGEVIGEHPGHQHFTIGQRKGIGVARGVPLYVINIDASSNTVTLGDRDALHRRGLVASQINVLSPRVERGRAIPCTAKIRYNHSPQPATLTVIGDDQLEVIFDSPQTAVTPGQAVVCYDNDVVLAGGWIDAALP
jgi:tRNA-specific 2-thiouridylase